MPRCLLEPTPRSFHEPIAEDCHRQWQPEPPLPHPCPAGRPACPPGPGAAAAGTGHRPAGPAAPPGRGPVQERPAAGHAAGHRGHRAGRLPHRRRAGLPRQPAGPAQAPVRPHRPGRAAGHARAAGRHRRQPAPRTHPGPPAAPAVRLFLGPHPAHWRVLDARGHPGRPGPQRIAAPAHRADRAAVGPGTARCAAAAGAGPGPGRGTAARSRSRRPGPGRAARVSQAEAVPADPIATAQDLAQRLAATAARRDAAGGTPKAERDALRASGLLALSIPRELGGLGADWVQTLETVRILATADGSLAHVYGFQHLHLATVQLFGQPAQWRPWLLQTARHRWFWGNTLNPLDRRTTATRQPGHWEFSGKKSFTSGALDSQMLVASAIDADSGQLLIGVVPTERTGITLLRDWDNMGQRQTDSGSALFERVRVEAAELLLDPGPLSTPHAALRPLLAQLILAHLFLGIAQGALEQARGYTLNEARPWFKSPADAAGADPHIQALYGELWAALEGARLLTLQAAQRFDAAWRRGPALTAHERGEVAVAVTAAKIATTRSGLDLSSRIFEATGARATHAALRFDRF